jgi:hypothetical protein
MINITKKSNNKSISEKISNAKLEEVKVYDFNGFIAENGYSYRYNIIQLNVTETKIYIVYSVEMRARMYDPKNVTYKKELSEFIKEIESIKLKEGFEVLNKLKELL